MYGLLLLGLFAGFCSAALGIGGGVVIVPALVIFFGYRIKRAIGTSLATIVPTSYVAIVSHYFIDSANIRLSVAGVIILGSLVGASFGAKLANRLSSELLRKLFALLLVFTGLKLSGIINIPTHAVTQGASLALILLGLVAGSASALFGIGGGVIMVPVLALFFGLTIHEAVATSLVVILPTTFMGAMFHRKFDNVDVAALKYLLPTAFIGAVLGALFANSMPAPALKLVFGIFLLLCSVRIFLQKKER